MPDVLNIPRIGAWEKVGKSVRGASCAEDAMVKAGLDWTVEKLPMKYQREDGALIAVPELFAAVRSDSQAVLGTVGPDYTHFQNVRAFEFMDGLVDSGEIAYETAGPLKSGRWIWLLAKMPGTMLIGGQDPVEKYLLLSNSHDGTKAITVCPTNVRVICQNTLQMALKSAVRRWSVRHLSTMEGRLQEARNALDLTFKYNAEFEIVANQLVDTPFTEADFESFLLRLAPSKDGKPTPLQNGIRLAYHTSTTMDGGIRDTKWGALQTVVEYQDFGRAPRTDNSALWGAWEAPLKDKAYALLGAV